MALVDYFLKLDGIDGESVDRDFAKWIEVTSWSWGETNDGGTFGGGGGAGKVVMQDFHFVSSFNKASPDLFLSCATGKHIKQATLVCRKAGGGQETFLKVTMTDLLVSSYQTGGASEIIPTDQVSLNFTRIELNGKMFDVRLNEGA